MYLNILLDYFITVCVGDYSYGTEHHHWISRGMNKDWICNIYIYIYIYIYMYIYISWSTVVESDLKASFSIVNTPMCKWGFYSFPWVAPLTVDPVLIMLSVKEGGIINHFLIFWYNSTCSHWKMSNHSFHIYIYIYIYIIKYILIFIYIFNSMEACLQPLVSCRLITTIIRHDCRN